MKKLFLLLLIGAALTTSGKAYTWDLVVRSYNFQLSQAYNNTLSEYSIDYYLYAGYFVYNGTPFYAWAAVYVWVDDEYMGQGSIYSKTCKRNVTYYGSYSTAPSSSKISRVSVAAYGECKYGKSETYYAFADAKIDY